MLSPHLATNSASKMSGTPAQQAELPIRSKSKDTESTPRDSELMTQVPFDILTEERTLRQQISIMGREVRRCSGVVQKQVELLSAYINTAKDRNLVEVENKKLRQDLCALKKENDNLLSQVQSQADELVFCGMPPKHSIEAKTKRLTIRLNDIQLQSPKLGQQLENFFFGLVKPTSGEVLELIDEVSCWYDGYQSMNSGASSSKLGGGSFTYHAGDEKPAPVRTPEPINNNLLTIRTALAEEALNCTNTYASTSIPPIEVRDMTITQAPPSVSKIVAESSIAASRDVSAEQTPTAELDAAPAVASASPSAGTSVSSISPLPSPSILQAPPSTPIRRVESTPARTSLPVLEAINTPLPPSPLLHPLYSSGMTDSTTTAGEVHGNGGESEPTTIGDIQPCTERLAKEKGDCLKKKDDSSVEKKCYSVPWNSANLLLLLCIVLCCIAGSIWKALSMHDTVAVAAAAAGLYVLVLLLL
jgi:hypothetical protein